MIKIIKIGLLVMVLSVIIGLFVYEHNISTAFNLNKDPFGFLVKRGEGVKTVAKNLEKMGAISSAKYFELYIWRTDNQSRIQAGEYVIEPDFTLRDIVNMLVSGDAIKDERTIKFIEGWSNKEVSQYFEKEGMFQGEELLELVGFPGVNYAKNTKIQKPIDLDISVLKDKPKNTGLEGYIFPDTYRIYSNANLVSIIEKAVNNLDEKFTTEMREEVQKQGKTIYEIMTMASIVEKEVRTDSDKKKVAGVLYKRIRSGMRLQVDSSVNYATGKNDPSVSFADLEVVSEYNTYKNDGLPPGPICNPGLSSIVAAIYFEESPYWFYLNRQDTEAKETIFSKDYNEHLRNKAKYLK